MSLGHAIRHEDAADGASAPVVPFARVRRASVAWQRFEVDRDARAALKNQRPCVIWLTGLSGAGKTTIANLVDQQLHAAGYHAFVLDGDNLRHGLNSDLRFSRGDRTENVRRVGEVAALMADAGLIVLVSLISPFRAERQAARALLPPGQFLEVFVDAPMAVAEQRDPKGLYARARRGELRDFTGIDSPYQPPGRPDLHIETAHASAAESAAQVLDRLRLEGIIR
jgi:bifunctional enzyme CysN/CysC